MTMPTLQHIGLILAIIGTIGLAISIKYEDEPSRTKKELEKLNPSIKFWYSTHVSIIWPLFYISIFLICIGTAFQW